eukprot:TRINITY_DN2332_c0_g1_i8.p3 TRINITY_DN2332_c0_g1~~TRINITY_DN2332_c0_g1_i8.p3  ORF type:complete len:215 (-),score=76.86 TRINITY_DN2332_c0_g1_i8:1003-1647(-)
MQIKSLGGLISELEDDGSGSGSDDSSSNEHKGGKGGTNLQCLSLAKKLLEPLKRISVELVKLPLASAVCISEEHELYRCYGYFADREVQYRTHHPSAGSGYHDLAHAYRALLALVEKKGTSVKRAAKAPKGDKTAVKATTSTAAPLQSRHRILKIPKWQQCFAVLVTRQPPEEVQVTEELEMRFVQAAEGMRRLGFVQVAKDWQRFSLVEWCAL